MKVRQFDKRIFDKAFVATTSIVTHHQILLPNLTARINCATSHTKIEMARPTQPGRSSPDFLDSTSHYLSCLGFGGYGVVLSAVNKLDEITAIKFIVPTDPVVEEQTRRECRLTVGLERHPNIVNILNFTEKKKISVEQLEDILKISPKQVQHNLQLKMDQMPTPELTCIQMELCGRSLRDWLTDQDTVAGNIIIQMKQVAISYQLINAVKFLHDHKIIHRDIKPANILFCKELELPIKLGDFGLSRLIQSEHGSSLTSNVETRGYAAPEVRGGKYSYQADLFSLGLVLWEVLGLIDAHKRGKLFDKLVYDEEEYLIKEHPLIGARTTELIVQLTRRKAADRLKDIGMLVQMTDYWPRLEIPDNEVTATTREELQLCLAFIPNNSTIYLVEGVYNGNFNLEKSNVRIVGKGEETVFVKSRFTIHANYCSLANVKFVELSDFCVRGGNNYIHDILFCHGNQAVRIDGNENTLRKLHIVSTVNGIFINGRNNTIDGVEFQDITNVGIFMSNLSMNTTISCVSGTNVKSGIQICGNDITIQTIHLSKSPHTGMQSTDLNNEEAKQKKSLKYAGRDDWGMLIIASNSIITDCICGPVYVEGNNTQLNNVMCGELLEINGRANDVNLVGCQAEKLVASAPIFMDRCKFQGVDFET